MSDDTPEDTRVPLRKTELDRDNPEWTARDFQKAKPAAELPTDILAAFPKTRES